MASVECKVCGQDNPPEARFCANCGATLVARAKPPAPTVGPSYPTAPSAVAMEYAGFWIRFGAAVVDYVVVCAALVILRLLFHTLLSYMLLFLFFLPWLYYWLFTGLKGQTPGKMLVGIKVVNAQGNIPGLGHAALREVLGKLISTIVLCLGFFWIAFDNNKQGWHDKLASTYVVKV